MTNALDANPAPSSLPAIVVFGRDDGGKPHASRFNEADAELAAKAATLMNMHVLRLETSEHHELAAKLPAGRVFASGKGFVPFVKATLYASLAVMGGIDPDALPPRPTSESGNAVEQGDEGRQGRLQSASADETLKIGTVVLAPEQDNGWWEAIVQKISGDYVTLRWRDYPDLPKFACRRSQIAQLPHCAE